MSQESIRQLAADGMLRGSYETSLETPLESPLQYCLMLTYYARMAKPNNHEQVAQAATEELG